MVSDIVETAKLLLTVVRESTGDIRKALFQATITLFVFVFCYCGCYVIREESFTKGILMSYQRSWLSKEQGTQIHSQASLHAGMVSEDTITRILTQILHDTPNSSRVRLALIHDGITTVTGVDLLRFDIVQSVAAPGHIAGDIMVNRPMSEWSPDYIPSLLARKCLVQRIDEVQNPVRRERLLELNTSWILACPVLDVDDQIFGTVFVSWDGSDSPPPPGPSLNKLMDSIYFYGRQLGTAMDMQREAN